MDIAFLKKLRDNPAGYPNESYTATIRPLSISEIEELESVYNGGSPFPLALRELLFLAGKFCYVLDYGLYDSQQEMQERVRNCMGTYHKVISRLFFAIDVYNDGDQFLFVYLDEGDDPAVFEGHYFDRSDMPNWITPVFPKLSGYIAGLIDRVKEGRNPF